MVVPQHYGDGGRRLEVEGIARPRLIVNCDVDIRPQIGRRYETPCWNGLRTKLKQRQLADKWRIGMEGC